MAARHGTALVTGASSGIGELYADRLARRGYDLVLVGRNAEKLGTLASSLAAKHGVKVESLVADLGDAAGLSEVERRLDSDASITLLVNSAGLIGGGPLSDGNLDALSQMLAVNVVALTRLASVAAKVFSARGTGAIINLASAMALIDNAGAAAYAASKAYVLSLSLSLDLDVKPKGVQVQAVLPGYTRTPMISDGAGLPDSVVMDADAMVDAALAGFDSGELVTIPSLESPAAFDAWVEKRADLWPHLSLSIPAPRYTAAKASAA
ncbi:SDR family NAD(P)-dependent oxidoreductase [Devosia sp.]|uniref:SDR family NAD(P)-dependent oxidoreductase n=1 Tax=Devosia sp. TaxID=1871048 RepID=UPI003BAAD199